MTPINKQKFLIELGRLLTFMSEDDRQEALTLYEKMFDDTDDEQALIQALLSPTRQAVVIARAYDANAHKLQAHTRSHKKTAESDESETTPDFVMAILQVYEECVSLPMEDEPVVIEAGEEESPAVIPEQFSLFETDEQPSEEAAYEETVLLHDAPEVQAEPLTAAAQESLDEVDSFIANFSIVDDELSAAPEESRSITVEETGEEKPLDSPVSPDVLPEPEPSVYEEYLDDTYSVSSSARRPKVFLLVLFILLAIPVTLIGIALLLIPTLLSLALAAGSIAGGCAGLVAAFGGFPVLADVLVVLGFSIVLLALGLLFLWLFVWFVGSAIIGLVHSVIQLGKSWCYEEVPA